MTLTQSQQKNLGAEISAKLLALDSKEECLEFVESLLARFERFVPNTCALYWARPTLRTLERKLSGRGSSAFGHKQLLALCATKGIVVERYPKSRWGVQFEPNGHVFEYGGTLHSVLRRIGVLTQEQYNEIVGSDMRFA